MSNEPQFRFLLYQTSDGQTRLEVRLENETVWLSQNQMAELFQTTKQNVSLHIRTIFKEGELPEGSVVKEFLTTAADGKNYKTSFYNLDVIIYRLRSGRGGVAGFLRHGAEQDALGGARGSNPCAPLQLAQLSESRHNGVRASGRVARRA